MIHTRLYRKKTRNDIYINNKMRKIITVGLIVIFLFQGYPAHGSELSVDSQTIQPTLNILYSGIDEFQFEYQVPEYKLETKGIDNQVIQTINVPGLLSDEVFGNVRLPGRHILLGVPAQASVELQVLEDVQAVLPLHIQRNSLKNPLTPTHSIYQTNSHKNPDVVAQISGDAWIRDQRVIGIGIFPFHTKPDTDQLVWSQKIKISVKFRSKDRADGLLVSDDANSPYEYIFASSLLNYLIARMWRGYPIHELGQYATSIPSSSLGPRYKIVVDQDGIYKITYEDLLAAGMQVGGINPAHLALKSQGKQVAIYISGETDGQFDPGDYILFYGQRYYGDIHAERYAAENLNWLTYDMDLPDGTTVPWDPQNNALMMEKYTNENVYWLLETAQSGLRMGIQNGNPEGSSASIPLNDVHTIHAEKETRYNSFTFTGEETWFWEWVQDKLTHVYTTTIDALSTEAYTATVSGEIVAYNSFPTSPDHIVKFQINNRTQPILTDSFEGKSRYHFDQNIPQSYLLKGVNQLKFTINSINLSQIYFDWFDIKYLRPFIAQQNQYDFSEDATGTWKHRIAGFTDPSIHILDITDPFTPTQIISASISGNNPYTITFTTDAMNNDRIILASGNSILSPKSLSFYNPPDLFNNQNGADYIFISHQQFLTKTLELSSYRESPYLRVKVYDVLDIYNEFNDGIPNPVAIKNFLTYAFSTWQPPAPRYALLVGDGHWNIKGFNPARYGTANVYLPPYLAWVDMNQGEMDSTNLLGTIVGSDIVPDIVIGRLPVNDVDQMTAILDKIYSYEQSGIQDWQRNVLLIADNIPDSAGNFEASAEYIVSKMSDGFQPLRIYSTDYCGPPTIPATRCPAVNRAITETINLSGTVIISYIGHGALQRWAHEQIFTNANINTLANVNRYPIVFSLTCWDGYWEWPNTQSLMEEMLRAPQKGTVSTFSPSGLGVASGHDALADGFYSAIFQDGIWELGAASTAAKLNLFMTGNNLDLVNNYLILGDPALLIQSPYGVSLPSQEQEKSGTVGTTVVYSITLNNMSVLTDTFSLSMSDNVWTTTVPVSIGPISGGSSGSFLVDVQVPRDAEADAYDSASIIATSWGDRSKYASIEITTTANVHGVSAAPLVDYRYAPPGSVVTYTVNITNTGNITDGFDLQAFPGEYDWDIVLPGTPITLSGGSSTSILVKVVILPEAIDHQEEFTMLKILSRGDPEIWLAIWLRTMATVAGLRYFIPNILKE